MRTTLLCVLACCLGLPACLTADAPPAASSSELITPPGVARAPCLPGTGPCVDVYVVARANDDLRFMNPSIADSLARGNRVVTVYVTAGDIEIANPDGSANQTKGTIYWTGRELGILDAYAHMTNPFDTWTASLYQPVGALPRVARYDRPSAAGSTVSVIFLRLPDGAAERMLSGNQTVTTLRCNTTFCPSPSTDLPAQTYSKDILLRTLDQLMTDLGARSISTLDATGSHFLFRGGPTTPFVEDSERTWVAQATVMAALRYQSRAAEPIPVRLYRGHTVVQEGTNLTPAQAVEKKRIFAYYAQHDVRASQTFPARTVGLPHGAPEASPGFDNALDDDFYPAREYFTRTLIGTADLQGKLSVTATANVPACLAASGTSPTVIACGAAPDWTLTARHQLKLAGTNSCLTVAGTGVTLASCTTRTAANTVFPLGNGQIITQDGQCLTAPATNGAPTLTECAPHCISEMFSGEADCPTDRIQLFAGAAGPTPDQDWTMLFTPVGLISTQFNGAPFLASSPSYYRTFAIVNRNICVRLDDGVWCAAGSGGGLAPAQRITTEYADSAGWLPAENGTTVAGVWNPITGTTMACGRSFFGGGCTTVGGTSSFATADGWSFTPYYGSMRYVDVNGDGAPDICARDWLGITCALDVGTGFTTATSWDPEGIFTDANGWKATGVGDSIQFADINGDGRLDVCGRHPTGVQCAINTGTAFVTGRPWSYDGDRRADNIGNNFSALHLDFSDTDQTGNWQSPAYYTFKLVDINRDGFADLCVRGVRGLSCELSNGSGFQPRRQVAPFEFTDATQWNDVRFGSTVTYGDLDGDPRVDVCGFGVTGVVCAKAY